MATTGVLPKDALQRLLDGLQTLIREHLALARAEAKQDLRALVRDAVVSAAGLPALFVGYVLLMVALSLALAGVLPAWAAFGVVALANLGAGALLTLVWGRRVAHDKLDLNQTGEELKKDKVWLQGLREGTAPAARLNGEGSRAELSQP